MPAMTVLRDALLIARHALRRLLWRPQTLLWVFAMPPLFFYFIGTVTTPGAGGLPGGGPGRIQLDVPPAGGVLVDELERRLRARGWHVTRVGSADGPLDRAPRLVIPPAYDHRARPAAQPARPAARPYLRGVRWGPAARSLQQRMSRVLRGLVEDLAQLEARHVEASAGALRRMAREPRSLQLDTPCAGGVGPAPGGFGHALPGILVMFTMLVLLTTGVGQLVEERQRGLLRRLASAPVSRLAVVAGRWGGMMALALVQIGVALLAGRLLFNADWGPSPAGLGILLGAWAAFNASLCLVLANEARTDAQASGLGLGLTMLLAALGGCWWPIEVAPRPLRLLARALPSGWAMDGVLRLAGDPMGWVAALPQSGALLAAALVLALIAARRFRYV